MSQLSQEEIFNYKNPDYNYFTSALKSEAAQTISIFFSPGKNLEFLIKYLGILKELKSKEKQIDWENFELIISQYYQCKISEVNNLMIELYASGLCDELCEDYSMSKGLATYQMMVNR